VAVVAALLVLRPGGVVVDDPEDGPLEGTVNAGAQLPVPAGARGVAFGLQILENKDPQGRDIVLRSVRAEGTHGGLTMSGTPYVFDHRRADVAQAGQLVTSIVPLPEEWRRVPRHALDGYVLRPSAQLSAEGRPDAELILEFEVPKKVAWLRAVVVEYDLGGRRHSVSLNSTLVLCPPGTPEEACPEAPPVQADD
jgi:hypothetical protein